MKKEETVNNLRSKIMRSVKSKNTGGEITVRQVLRASGYHNYRLHVRNLPGTPDIVFIKIKKAIFVNGCFWHGHECSKGRLPKSNIDFWKAKLEKNIARDEKVIGDLEKLGWKALVVWQCEIKHLKKVEEQLKAFLSAAA